MRLDAVTQSAIVDECICVTEDLLLPTCPRLAVMFIVATHNQVKAPHQIRARHIVCSAISIKVSVIPHCSSPRSVTTITAPNRFPHT